jgi:hypothetical protein
VWLLGAALVGGRALLDMTLGSDSAESWQRAVEVLTAAVTVAVALNFSAGDPPRRPWTVLATAMALLPVVRLLSHFQVKFAGIAAAHVLLIVGNVAMAAAVIGFGRVLGSSELLEERSAEDRVRATTFVALLATGALAMLAFPTLELVGRGVPATLGAWFAAAAIVVSTLCDALVFAGGMYLVWLVRPLLGGSLARPYLLIAIAGGAFLVVDMLLVTVGATTQTELLGTDLRTFVTKWLGCLAFTGFALAGATQFALLRSARRR